jgi:dihydroorotase
MLYAACFCAHMGAQPYDLIIKGGHVIDPADGINGVMDVAVAHGKIARVAAQISVAEAKKS